MLRAIEPEDSAMLLRLINDPDTEQMLGGSSFPVSAASQAKWMEQQRTRDDVLRCVIVLPDKQDEGLGTVILSDIDQKNGTAQIHLKLDASARNKGYGTDAVCALTNYAFRQLRLQCIYADILSYNEVSQRLFTKCGFQREGVLRSRVYKGGKYCDIISYSCLEQDLVR